MNIKLFLLYMANKHKEIILSIPDNIDFDRLFSKIDFYTTKHKKSNTLNGLNRVKESVFLFLHFLYPNHYYLEKYRENGYFKPILSKDFNSITRCLMEISVDILTDNDYPIIEVNRSYQVGKYSKSYKLKNDFFIFCNQKRVEIQSSISDNYHKKILENSSLITSEEDCNLLPASTLSDYYYILKNFTNEIITIDEIGATAMIDLIEEKLLEKNVRCRQEEIKRISLKKIENRIIRMRRCVRLIQNGEFNVSVSSSNNRLYSAVTECNKEIRRFIKINGNNINEIDIKNSHLYNLAQILNKNFYKTNNNLSLNKIYNDLYKLLDNNLYSYNSIILRLLNNREDIHQYNKSTIPYMCGVIEKEDVCQYISLPYKQGIYEYLNEYLFENTKNRKYIKDNVMKFLYLKDYRNDNDFVRKMVHKFPTVDSIIKIINGVDDTRGWLSILLQRIESYLLLNIGVKSVLDKFPNFNFLTVHDSVLVEEKNSKIVHRILEVSITEETGIPIGFKIKSCGNPMDDIDEIIDEKWKDVLKSVRRERNKTKVK